MPRLKVLVIKLNDREHDAIQAMADRAMLPASTYARRILLREAERQGLYGVYKIQQPDKSEVEP